MHLKRPIFAFSSAVLALSLFACAKGSTGGGRGGSGGDSWGSSSSGITTSNASSSSGTSSSSGVGGGGPSVCDNTGTCQTCADCSVAPGGSCVSVFDACNANQDCVLLNNCIVDCAGDSTCINNCANSLYPGGVNDLLAYQDCVVCVDCPSDCDAATYGCP